MAKVLEAFLARDDFALRRKDGADAHQVLRCDSGIPKGQLKGGQTLLVFAYTLGKKQLLRDHAFSQFLCIRSELQDRGFRETFPVESIAFGRLETARTKVSCYIHSSGA